MKVLLTLGLSASFANLSIAALTKQSPIHSFKEKRALLSCAETYGDGSITCGDATSRYCYDPTQGETCCPMDNGYCKAGDFCAPVAGFCCTIGEDPETCAERLSFTLPPSFSTAQPTTPSTSTPASTPTTFIPPLSTTPISPVPATSTIQIILATDTLLVDTAPNTIVQNGMTPQFTAPAGNGMTPDYTAPVNATGSAAAAPAVVTIASGSAASGAAVVFTGAAVGKGGLDGGWMGAVLVAVLVFVL